MTPDFIKSLGSVVFTAMGSDPLYSRDDADKDAANRRSDESVRLAAKRLRQARCRQLYAESRAKNDAALKERQFRYRQGKDWIADFYRRNEIFMKTGQQVPRNFDKLLRNTSPQSPQGQ